MRLAQQAGGKESAGRGDDDGGGDVRGRHRVRLSICCHRPALFIHRKTQPKPKTQLKPTNPHQRHWNHPQGVRLHQAAAALPGGAQPHERGHPAVPEVGRRWFDFSARRCVILSLSPSHQEHLLYPPPTPSPPQLGTSPPPSRSSSSPTTTLKGTCRCLGRPT